MGDDTHLAGESIPQTDVVSARLPVIVPHSPVAGLRRKDQRKNLMFNQFLVDGQPKRQLRVGRAPDCDITLPLEDTRVSKTHCVIERLPTGLWAIRDTSTNGTFIHRPEDPFAEPLDGIVVLSLSMEIWIDSYTFLPLDVAGKIGVFAVDKTELHARAFERYQHAREASNATGVSMATIYNALRKYNARDK